LTFSLRWHTTKIRVLITGTEATYSLVDGTSKVTLSHHGQEFILSAEAPVTFPIEKMVPLTPRPRQPAGRAPSPALSEY
jgi:alpha,alpha-trehalose phosphorylase